MDRLDIIQMMNDGEISIDDAVFKMKCLLEERTECYTDWDSQPIGAITN